MGWGRSGRGEGEAEGEAHEMSLQDRDGGGVPSQHGVLGWYGTSRWDGEPGQWGGRDAQAPLEEPG